MINASGITFLDLSLAEAQTAVKPLILFIAGIVIYSIFIFKFYRFIAKRDIFSLNLQKYSQSLLGTIKNIVDVIFYMVDYLLVFPLFTFFWFLILTLVLSTLSKSDVSSLLLIAIALVSSIRITAYYNEDLSKDLAKMLPFALLGVFLLDIGYFSLEASIATIKGFPAMWKTMIYYLGFIILLEFVLRILHVLTIPFRTKKESVEETEEVKPVKKDKKK